MLIDHESMMRWRCVVLAFALTACTKPNPRSCVDGTCTDPAFPFCDENGEVEGQQQTCIAVECEPGEFRACRGDLAITCNSTGTNFDLITCDRGCDDGVGCRLCDPNETACTNGMVATCDAAGVVTGTQACPLGCFESEPRCRDIDPSNGLGQFLDMASTAADFVLDGGAILVDSGTVIDGTGTPIVVPTTLLPAPAGGSSVRVFIAKRVQISGVVYVSSGNGASNFTGPAIAIVSNGDIEITGRLVLRHPDENRASAGTPGGMDVSTCNGGKAVFKGITSPAQTLFGGGGGGGHATAGGAGGFIDPGTGGGVAGMPSGTSTLIPLRGGCRGSEYGGGGAIQLVSRTAIALTDGAEINANGLAALMLEGQLGNSPAEGGGAGGGILLEAPTIRIGIGAAILANGGAGASGDLFPPSESLTTAAAPGSVCTNPPTSMRCGNGGDGAGLDGPATNGANVAYTNAASVTLLSAGGGGGGLGYIRINTQTGTFEQASNSIVSGSLSTAPINTR